eukprot:COSAG06_NODE_52804_length_303_cov_1.848039_1_plen_57_part_01
MWGATLRCKNVLCCAIFESTMIVLSRQARDRQREKLVKVKDRSLAGCPRLAHLDLSG